MKRLGFIIILLVVTVLVLLGLGGYFALVHKPQLPAQSSPTILIPTTFLTLPSSESPLTQAIQQAAVEFEIPDRLLLALAYNNGKFGGGKCEAPPVLDFYSDHPPLSFGPFALTKEEIEYAGTLLNQHLTLESIICDVELSVRAQAALLKDATKSNSPKNSYNPLDWENALITSIKNKYQSLDDEVHREIVSRILSILKLGAKGTDAWQNYVELPPS